MTTTCTERIAIDCSPEDAGAFLRDVHNLPSWNGFFREVGRPVGDRFEVRTAMGTTIRTRIEHKDERYAISSLVGEREERAEIVVLPSGGGVDVRLTLRVRPELAEHAAATRPEAPGDRPVDGVAIQRARMRDELRRLRAVLSLDRA
jgi:hypothetical protein